MRGRTQAADVVAIVILVVLVSVLGTGIGVAAAHVRSSGSEQHGPLRMILHPSDRVQDGGNPSLQRDRARLRPGR